VLDLEDDDGFEVLEDEADGGLWFLRGLRRRASISWDPLGRKVMGVGLDDEGLLCKSR
jgi:hypothetical protein